MNVFGYVRVSSRSQKDNFSIGIQKEEIQKWVNEHQNGSVKFYEEIASGKNANEREVYLRMLKDITKEKPNFVVVSSISRFGRNVIDGLTAIRDMEKTGTRFITLDFKLNTENPIEKSMLTNLLTWQEMQREEQILKIKAGIKAAKDAGIKFGRKKIKVNIDQVNKWLKQGYTLQSIADNKLKISVGTLRARLKEQGYKRSYIKENNNKTNLT